MTLENDNLRRLVLLMGDVNQCEIRLSELRNRIMESRDKMPEYVQDEIPELAATILRINKEFSEILKSALSTLRLQAPTELYPWLQHRYNSDRRPKG